MSELTKKIQPADIIAVLVILCGFTLIYAGKNGTVSAILTAVVAFYFGKNIIEVKKNPTLTIEDTITNIARSEGVDPNLAVRVAMCESSLNPNAVNTNSNGSVDRGIFQWNDKWHPEISDVCAFNIKCATKAFCKAFKEDHLSWWDATKKCWDK